MPLNPILQTSLEEVELLYEVGEGRWSAPLTQGTCTFSIFWKRRQGLCVHRHDWPGPQQQMT